MAQDQADWLLVGLAKGYMNAAGFGPIGRSYDGRHGAWTARRWRPRRAGCTSRPTCRHTEVVR